MENIINQQRHFRQRLAWYINTNYSSVKAAAFSFKTSYSHLHRLLAGEVPFSHLYIERLKQLGIEIEGMDKLVFPKDLRTKYKTPQVIRTNKREYEIHVKLKTIRKIDSKRYEMLLNKIEAMLDKK